MSMELETLTCNNCGAPLQVPPDANYVTCAHCGSQLMVHRTDSAHYTEVMQKLAGLSTRTDQMATQMHKLRVDNDLLRLDQDWEQSRGDYMINTKGGQAEPTLGRTILGAVGAVLSVLLSCFVLLPQAGTVDGGIGVLYFIMLLVVGGFSIYAAVEGFMKYNAYKEAAANYYSMRSTLEEQRNKPSTGSPL